MKSDEETIKGDRFDSGAGDRLCNLDGMVGWTLDTVQHRSTSVEHRCSKSKGRVELTSSPHWFGPQKRVEAQTKPKKSGAARIQCGRCMRLLRAEGEIRLKF